MYDPIGLATATPRLRSATVIVASAVLLAIVALGLRGAPEAAAAPAPIRMAIATLAPEGTPWGDALVEIKTRIEAASAGRLKVVLFLGGRRGNDREMLDELRGGKLHGAALIAGTLAAEVPELELFELPFLFRDLEEVDLVVDGVAQTFMPALFEQHGLVGYAWSENGLRSIASRGKPVRRPEDLAGMKMRATESAVSLAFWRSLGATPIAMPPQEVIAALAAGTLDGLDQAPVYLVATGWHERLTSLTLTEHIYQPGIMVYAKPFLDALPADLREIVLRDGPESARRNRAAIRAAAAEVTRDLEGKISLIRPTAEEREAFRGRTAPLYEAYRKGPLGPTLARIEAALEAHRATKGKAK